MGLALILSVLLGAAIGLSLGALGGGGSILTVPALVYALAVSAKDATGASLLIVGLSALIGMLAAWKLFDVVFQPLFLLAVNLLYPGVHYG